jgi:hypothetical protein
MEAICKENADANGYPAPAACMLSKGSLGPKKNNFNIFNSIEITLPMTPPPNVTKSNLLQYTEVIGTILGTGTLPAMGCY